MSEITVTSQNFDQEVLASDKPVLLDFWAVWCGPCRMLSPVISKIAGEHPEIKVGKVNVDEQPELAERFRINAIPTVLLMKNGKVANTSVGYVSENELLAMLR